MLRTTSVLVGGIIEVDSNIDLSPFIEVANELVTEVCDSDLGDTRLEKIERYLAAHFYTLRDPRTTSERAGPVGASFQSKVDLFLESSHYGQMAMVLDTSGGLANLNATAGVRRITASADWVGTDEDEDD